MSNIIIETSNDIALRLAKDFKNLRKSKKISQKQIANLSGVSYGSVRRFEETGEISFVSLLHLARVVNKLEGFDNLFKNEVKYKDMEEVLNSWKK